VRISLVVWAIDWEYVGVGKVDFGERWEALCKNSKGTDEGVRE
jgi:hypothetical protein